MGRMLRVVVTVVALVLAGCSDPPPEDTSSEGATSEGPVQVSAGPSAADLAAGTWTALDEPPVEPRSDAVSVWSGTEVLFWGGFADPPNDVDNRMHDGAALDPVTGAWRAIPGAPIDPSFQQTAVWTGTEMIVYGWQGSGGGGYSGTPSEIAAYDPTADTWRVVPADPQGIITPALVTWTGAALLVLGVVSDDLSGAFTGAAYDPVADTWTTIAPTPLEGHLGGVNAVWTGDRAIVWGGTETANIACTMECPAPVPARSAAAAYDPAADAWTALPDAPGPVREPARVVRADDRAAVLTGREVVTYDPDAGTADLLGSQPSRPSSDGVGTPLIASIWTGDGLLSMLGADQRYSEEYIGGPSQAPTDDPILTGEVLALDGTVTPLPEMGVGTATGQSVVWTGTSLVVWGGRQQAGATRDTAAERARGAILTAAGVDLPPPPAPAVDFLVTGGGAVVDGVEVTVTPVDPQTLALGGELGVAVEVTAQAAVDVEITGIRSVLTAAQASGRLVLVPAGCEGQSLAPQRGAEAVCPSPLVTATRLGSGERLSVQATLVTQWPPFAPTGGTYPVVVDLLVDGQPVVAAPALVLAPTSELGRITHPLQREQRVMLQRDGSCAGHSKVLTNGAVGPGSLSVGVDAVGWWGRLSFGARAVSLALGDGQVVGDIGELAFLAVDGVRLQECATTPANARLTEESDRHLRAVLTYDDLTVDVLQEVLPPAPDGSAALRQTYVVSVAEGPERTVALTRLTDASAVDVDQGDRPEDPSASADGAVLDEQAGSGPVTVSVSGSLAGREVPDCWAIAALDPLQGGVVAAGGIPDALADALTPFDGPGRYIPFSSAALAQQWDATVAPGRPATLVLTTTFSPSS